MRSDQWNSGISGKSDQPLHLFLVPFNFRVSRYFQKTMLAERFFVPICGFARFVTLLFLERSCVFAVKGGKYRHESVFEFFNDLAVDARAVVKSFEMRDRNELHQIAISGLIAREQYEPRRSVIDTMFFVVACAQRDEKIHTDDGLQSLLIAFFVKIYRAVEIAVVGERK